MRCTTPISAEIKEPRDQEWVELNDYDWPEDEECPRSSIVRAHSPTRREFYALAAKDSPDDSANLFVGKQKLPKDQIFSLVMRLESE
jgi:hypothetical protein